MFVYWLWECWYDPDMCMCNEASCITMETTLVTWVVIEDMHGQQVFVFMTCKVAN